MKQLLILLLLISSNIINAQTLKPTIGIHFTGGLEYTMEHEVPSVQLGMIYEFKPNFRLSASGNFYYDFVNEVLNNTNTFYVVRVQPAVSFTEEWSVTSYLGYVNSFDNNLMKSFTGKSTSRLAWGAGLQIEDERLIGEILFENLAGFTHLSVGVNYKFNNILKK